MSTSTKIQPLSLTGIDLETCGLQEYQEINGKRVHGASYFPILSIGVVLLEDNHSTIKDKFEVGIRLPVEKVSLMCEYVFNMHTDSGLLDRLNSSNTEESGFDLLADDYNQAVAYVINRLEANGATKYKRKEKTGSVLFGNNVSYDAAFMDAQLPELASFFHYRKIDVSSIAMLERTAWNGLIDEAPKKKYEHTALADITETFNELEFYTNNLFVKNVT